MNTIKKSFVLHLDSLDVLDDLTSEQKAQLFDAIRDYHLGKEVNLSGLMKAVFTPFKNQFNRDLEKYKSVSERNRANGKKGGRPNKAEKQKDKENPKKPKKPTGLIQNPLEPKKPDSDNDSDNDNDSEKDNEKDIEILNHVQIDKFQFLEIWNKARVHFKVAKESNANMFPYQSINDLKDLTEVYNKEDFQKALTGLMKQKGSFAKGFKSNIKHFLQPDHFERYLDAYNNKNFTLYDSEEKQGTKISL